MTVWLVRVWTYKNKKEKDHKKNIQAEEKTPKSVEKQIAYCVNPPLAGCSIRIDDNKDLKAIHTAL